MKWMIVFICDDGDVRRFDRVVTATWWCRTIDSRRNRHVAGGDPRGGGLGQDLRAEPAPAVAAHPARLRPQALHGVRGAAQPREAAPEEDTQRGALQGAQRLHLVPTSPHLAPPRPTSPHLVRPMANDTPVHII